MSTTLTPTVYNFGPNKQLGYVKWFKRTGFGFITVIMSESPFHGTDIFVHHSDLVVPSGSDSQYRYLMQGEYVEFEVTEAGGSSTAEESSTGKKEHKWKATNVTGINGGKLMCVTRAEMWSNTEGATAGERSRSAASSGGDNYGARAHNFDNSSTSSSWRSRRDGGKLTAQVNDTSEQNDKRDCV